MLHLKDILSSPPSVLSLSISIFPYSLSFDSQTYLEYINMYKRLVTIKATELDQQIARLQTGKYTNEAFFL